MDGKPNARLAGHVEMQAGNYITASTKKDARYEGGRRSTCLPTVLFVHCILCVLGSTYEDLFVLRALSGPFVTAEADPCCGHTLSVPRAPVTGYIHEPLHDPWEKEVLEIDDL